MPWTASIDGGSRGNPGPGGAGVQISDESGRVVFLGGFALGRMTNNQAEYRGLLAGLDLLRKAGARDIIIHTDSELMARQISGAYRVKSPDLRPLYEQAMRLLDGFERFQVRHVPREQNTRADKMVNQALDAGMDVVAADALGLAPAAAPAGSVPASPAKPPAGGQRSRRIEVRVLKPADQQVCPAGMRRGQVFLFGDAVPSGLCVEACAAVVEGVLALQGQDVSAGEVAGMTPQCPRQGCGAVFEVRPQRPGSAGGG